jgi:hypothetical protein
MLMATHMEPKRGQLMEPPGKGAQGVSDLHSNGVSLPNQISGRGGPQMANRRFEMHEIRRVIVQMRLGLTDR